MPSAYITTIYAICCAKQNFLIKLFRITLWIILGIPVLIVKCLKDTANLALFLFEIKNKNKNKKSFSHNIKQTHNKEEHRSSITTNLVEQQQNLVRSKKDIASYVLEN